jgi:hypothetical protein
VTVPIVLALIVIGWTTAAGIVAHAIIPTLRRNSIEVDTQTVVAHLSDAWPVMVDVVGLAAQLGIDDERMAHVVGRLHGAGCLRFASIQSVEYLTLSDDARAHLELAA